MDPQICSITCTLRPPPWTPNSESPTAYLRASQVNFSGSLQKSPSAHRIWRTHSLAPAPRLRITWPLNYFVHHVPFPKPRFINQFKQEYLYAWPLITLKGHKSSFAEDKNKKLPERQILSTLQFCFKECGVKETTTLDSFNARIKRADVTCWLIVPVQEKRKEKGGWKKNLNLKMVDMRKQYFSPISWHEKDKLRNSNFP